MNKPCVSANQSISIIIIILVTTANNRLNSLMYIFKLKVTLNDNKYTFSIPIT